MDTKKDKPYKLKAILWSIISFIIFELLYLVAYLLMSLIIIILCYIPIVNSLLTLFFSFIRKDSLDIVIAVASVTCGYYFVSMILRRFCTSKIQSIVCRVIGILLLIIHVIFLVINIISPETSILANIVHIGSGIAFIAKSSHD